MISSYHNRQRSLLFRIHCSRAQRLSLCLAASCRALFGPTISNPLSLVDTMPPQVAARMTSVASKAKTTSKTNKGQATPSNVPSSAEKLGAHGAKVKHKRRFCRIEGCERIVKSQGLCQRHGAKPRLCKVIDCTKQAQGNFDGKAEW